MPLPIFSNYTVIRELGQGGMATVYLATHNTLGHQVAIKILDKQFTYNQNIKARFIEEAKKLVRLDHPNVVKVTDFISENEHVAYVMEYINGKSLRELLNSKRLTDVEIENYLNQMVVALNYIHKEGIVHRDIKPSNFIIATNGTLKLVDFGISKSIDASSVDHTSTSTNLSMGTLLYMSPEQIKSTKDVTYLSDIYSLGVMLWEMAMGKVPYNTSELSAFDIQVKIVQEKLPNTNTKWDEYIQIATSKEENQRVRFIDLLKNKHFNQTTNNNKTDKNEKTIIEPSNYKMPENPPKRSRKLFYFGISILLFSVIGFFYLFWPEDELLISKESLHSKLIYIENNTDDNLFVSYAIYDDSLKEFITQGWDYYEKDSAYSFELTDYHSKKIFWHAFKEKSGEIISNQGYQFCVNYEENFTNFQSECNEKSSFNLLKIKDEVNYLKFDVSQEMIVNKENNIVSKIYNDVNIGNQIWQSSNFDLDHFADGTKILKANNAKDWINAGSNKIPAYKEVYVKGSLQKIYNAHCVHFNKTLLSGYHVPTDDEWKQLFDFCGGVKNAAKVLKSKKYGGLDSYGFNAIPCGSIHFYMDLNGESLSGGDRDYGGSSLWWTNQLIYDNERNQLLPHFVSVKDDWCWGGEHFFGYGCSVRLVKD